MWNAGKEEIRTYTGKPLKKRQTFADAAKFALAGLESHGYTTDNKSLNRIKAEKRAEEELKTGVLGRFTVKMQIVILDNHKQVKMSERRECVCACVCVRTYPTCV